MAASFFFYDLETSGIDPRAARIMQFAGQRTDMNLNPIGEPVNVMIKLTPDVLPEPDAVLLTGITPQQTLVDGLTEAEFLDFFYKEVVQDGTVFLGFNTVRFDDEFMRYLHYRNFYDAYEWQWCNDCSRWDLLDVIRMTRALRPEGIEWPVTEEGKPTNRLELLTKANKLDHEHAHDALSDVTATIAVAKLIREKQPDLFNYLLECRSKQVVKDTVLKGQPFVYTTGRYSSEWLHTSAAVLLAKHPKQDCAIVYDLRFDPEPFMKMNTAELAAAWRYNPDPKAQRLPVKTLKYNRCPAVAPLGVMKDASTQERLKLSIDTVMSNLKKLSSDRSFVERLMTALDTMDGDRDKQRKQAGPAPVDARLYDAFLGDGDKQAMRMIRAAKPDELSGLGNDLHDDRLKQLLPLYKARNYPTQLSSEERAEWDIFVRHNLLDGGQNSRAAKYFQRLQELAAKTTDSNKQFLLEELQLYGESIMPGDVAD